MKNYLTIMLMCAAFTSFAGENLIKNGDFEKGTSSWRGNRDVEFETAAKKNKICKIEAHRHEFRVIHQKVELPDDCKKLTLKFRVKKSLDFQPTDVGFGIRGSKEMLASSRQMPKNGDWTIVKYDLPRKYSTSHRLEISISAPPSRHGYLCIDDVELIADE